MDWNRTTYSHVLAAADSDSLEIERLMHPPPLTRPWHIELMHAVLENAITEADLKWINLEDEGHIFSFRSCCETLGIDADAARAALNAKIEIKKPLRKKKQPRSELIKEIVDVPGITYTHAYNECPVGLGVSFCTECRQRYNYRYNSLHPRGIRMRRHRLRQMARINEVACETWG